MIFYLVFEYFIIVSIGVVLFICGGRLLQNVMGAEPVTQANSLTEPSYLNYIIPFLFMWCD